MYQPKRPLPPAYVSPPRRAHDHAMHEMNASITPCPACFPHRGWAHGDESRRKQRDYCRSCLGSGVLREAVA